LKYKILRMYDSARITDRGELIATRHVDYMIDELGPFTYVVDVAEFSWKKLKEFLEGEVRAREELG